MGCVAGGFVEMQTGAQFSQLEEKVADDYGLSYLKKEGYAPEKAVSALKKLATLGSSHSFLSSHPEPQARAERLSMILQGKTLSFEETKQSYVDKVKSRIGFIDMILSKLAEWLPSLFSYPAQK